MTALLLFNALFGVLLASVLLRAQWRRRDNQLLAVAALLDAALAAVHLMLTLRGVELTSPLFMRIWMLGRVLVMYPLLAFTYAFPLGRVPPPWVRRIALGLTSVVGLGLLHHESAPLVDTWPVRLLYFAPFSVAMARVLRQNLRGLSGEATRSANAVVFALVVRCAAELVTHVIIRPLFPGALDAALIVDLIVANLSYAIVAQAVLRHRFFRVRGAIAEAVLYGTLALSCICLTGLGLELAARSLDELPLRFAAFAVLSLVPLGAWLLIQHYAPRLEAALVHPFDPRRGTLKNTLQRAIRDSANLVDAKAMVELTTHAIATLSEGSATLFWVAQSGSGTQAANEPALARALTVFLERTQLAAYDLTQFEHAPEALAAFLALDAEALVTVRAQHAVLGAIAIRGTAVDEEMLDTAKALADNLGSKLAHHALYERAFELSRQLEASRQLASLGSLTAAIAHDIRTPLTSMKMNLDMIRRTHGLSETLCECADIALDELHRLNDYVSGILDYVKPVRLRAIDIDLVQLLEETSRTMRPVLESRRVSLHLSLPEPASPVWLRADASRLKQVLVNLIENAADASPREGIVAVSVRRTTDKATEHVVIEVRDHGHGIAESELARICEPFFTTRVEGTGLGLAIVSKLVRAHDGELLVESQKGLGSTFAVVLPTSGPSEPSGASDAPYSVTAMAQ